jgi:hypothetical protein
VQHLKTDIQQLKEFHAWLRTQSPDYIKGYFKGWLDGANYMDNVNRQALKESGIVVQDQKQSSSIRNGY